MLECSESATRNSRRPRRSAFKVPLVGVHHVHTAAVRARDHLSQLAAALTAALHTEPFVQREAVSRTLRCGWSSQVAANHPATALVSLILLRLSSVGHVAYRSLARHCLHSLA